MTAGPGDDAVPTRVGRANALERAGRERAQRLAVRVVAGRATSEEDCRELLDMLGIAGAAGLTVAEPPVRF